MNDAELSQASAEMAGEIQSEIDKADKSFSFMTTADGFIRIEWTDYEGEKATADLDPNSKDVADAVKLIRHIIWGD